MPSFEGLQTFTSVTITFVTLCRATDTGDIHNISKLFVRQCAGGAGSSSPPAPAPPASLRRFWLQGRVLPGQGGDGLQ